MAIKTMIRYEEKFIINAKQYQELSKHLMKYMSYDQYSENQTFYKIVNLYFDTFDYHVIRESLSQPRYKEKLRIRCYHCVVTDTDNVFVEMKKKINGLIVKRRIKMNYKVAIDWIVNKIEPQDIPEESLQVYNEINYYLSQNELGAKVFIGYERLAYTSKADDHLRVTFDQNVVCRKSDLGMSHCEGTPLLKENEYLLEIKSDQNFPMWLVTKLNELRIYARHYSKYGAAYEYYTIGEQR